MEPPRFSPRAFLRARRPERFSDSVAEDSIVLDRSLLEYHLDTLTSRSQETDFERFARHLAEREICPNLLPQTGPTGGGDSKVDAETYPVADDLSLGWYVGIGREAASERWAFAFSTKKEWRSKVRSDVAKIATTGRGYAKAFFVSNQFVPDRVRAKVEDELRSKFGLDVRILDRSWILDKVFGNGHVGLAIEDLGLKMALRKEVQKGPLDLQRERDLEDLEHRIESALQERRFGLSLVDDCIEAAELSRSLERPQAEVDGRFVRAARVAKKYGTSHQHLKSVYQRAWTAFWWHEDYELLVKLYDTAEEIAKGSHNAYDLELLHNLWFLLFGAVNRGDLDREATGFEQRTVTLAAELERLSKEQDRPSTSLQARTLLLHQRLALSLPEEPDPILRELRDVVHQCAGLVGYPFEPFAKVLMELGKFIGDLPAYEELFETLITVTSTRKGEVSGAHMLLKRGAQHLDADRPYEAVRVLGRALRRLYKHESRMEVIRALYLCGSAYERVGLLWAARGTMLTAASVATNEYWTQSEITPLQAACYNRMKWIELQLGRLPHILAWHELDNAVRSVLNDKGYDREQLSSGETEFDVILGILTLRADIWQLKQMTTLPDALDSMHLDMASLALIYALGHEEELPADLSAEGEEAVRDYFVKWRDQPAANDLPTLPSLYESRTVTLSSIVLGCRIIAECENVSPCVELAESVLAAFESLLSTSAVDRVIAREPVLTINIRKATFAEDPFGFEVKHREGRPHVEIRCASFDPHSVSLDVQEKAKHQLYKLLVHLFAYAVFVDDADEMASKLFGDDLALERAINFTSSFVALGNVLGHDPKTRLTSWVRPGAREYPLRRREEWDVGDRRAKQNPESMMNRVQPTMGKGEPPVELQERARIKHTQMETVSLIRETLWEQASWVGTGFIVHPNGEAPPILAPVFKGANAARQIFAQWRKELGKYDEEERLRITIIRGISTANPYAYRIVIGANPAIGFSRPDIKVAFFVARIRTEEPVTNRSLEAFLPCYTQFDGYFFAPAIVAGVKSEPVLEQDNWLGKRELHVRQAWEIGRHDIDSVGVTEDDDPIIPPGQKDAPVLELLRWKREHAKTRERDRSAGT
jgi:hypothetical protein